MPPGPLSVTSIDSCPSGRPIEQTALPAAAYNVYSPAELVLLALAGPVIAVAGSLAPATWAARTSTALALRAE